MLRAIYETERGVSYGEPVYGVAPGVLPAPGTIALMDVLCAVWPHAKELACQHDSVLNEWAGLSESCRAHIQAKIDVASLCQPDFTKEYLEEAFESFMKSKIRVGS